MPPAPQSFMLLMIKFVTNAPCTSAPLLPFPSSSCCLHSKLLLDKLKLEVVCKPRPSHARTVDEAANGLQFISPRQPRWTEREDRERSRNCLPTSIHVVPRKFREGRHVVAKCSFKFCLGNKTCNIGKKGLGPWNRFWDLRWDPCVIPTLDGVPA